MFQVPTTIDPDEDGVHCGYCPQLVIPDQACHVFATGISYDFWNDVYKRCAACLAAEKEAKHE